MCPCSAPCVPVVYNVSLWGTTCTYMCPCGILHVHTCICVPVGYYMYIYVSLWDTGIPWRCCRSKQYICIPQLRTCTFTCMYTCIHVSSLPTCVGVLHVHGHVTGTCRQHRSTSTVHFQFTGDHDSCSITILQYFLSLQSCLVLLLTL